MPKKVEYTFTYITFVISRTNNTAIYQIIILPKVMKKLGLFFLFLSILIVAVAATPYLDIKSHQLGYERVKTAYAEKEQLVKASLLAKGISSESYQLYLRAFKNEGVLEAWVKPNGKDQFQLFKTYDICQVSGALGPKEKQGDFQTPEGFYYIDRFNPKSNFYLSLGIDYPNTADRRRSDAQNLGGDIFIHGSCETVGCLPMNNDQIKEIYVLSVEASDHGQAQIPVHIFPYRINNKIYDDSIFETPKKLNEEERELIKFRRNLGEGMIMFDRTRTLPSITVDQDGKYQFSQDAGGNFAKL